MITLEVQPGEFKGNVMFQAQRIADNLGVTVRFYFNGEWVYVDAHPRSDPSVYDAARPQGG